MFVFLHSTVGIGTEILVKNSIKLDEQVKVQEPLRRRVMPKKIKSSVNRGAFWVSVGLVSKAKAHLGRLKPSGQGVNAAPRNFSRCACRS